MKSSKPSSWVNLATMEAPDWLAERARSLFDEEV